MQANSWHQKSFHFHLSFWIWKVWKGRKKVTKIWIFQEPKELFGWKKPFFIVAKEKKVNKNRWIIWWKSKKEWTQVLKGKKVRLIESQAKMQMEALKTACKEIKFHIWMYDRKIMNKHVNDNKIKTYNNWKINVEVLLQMTINSNHLFWKSCSRYFV